MKSFTSTAALASMALLQYASADMSGMAINAHPSAGCDDGGYYTEFSIGTGFPSCTINYMSDPLFTQTTSGAYNIWWDIPQPDPGCEIFLRSPADVTNPGCGNVIAHSDHAVCAELVMAVPFDINYCCGVTDCANALKNPISKRDTNITESATVDVAAIKRTNPFASRSTDVQAPNTKRDACGWVPAGEQYTTEGIAQKVTTEQTCSVPEGCTISQSRAVETSTSTTFSMDETTEVGFLDIVSESIDLGYSYTSEQSTSTTIQISYDVPSGATGYLTFTPTLICTQGALSGDCADGLPAVGNQGNACFPAMLSDGITPDGTTNLVQDL